MCKVDYGKGTKTCNTRELVEDICVKHFKWCRAGDIPPASSSEKPEAGAAADAQHDDSAEGSEGAEL